MTNTNEHEDDTEVVERRGSVVKSQYKRLYAERAANMARKPKGLSHKVLKRCNGDWLAIELARRTLDDKDRLDIAAFDAILEANGVTNKWKHLNVGQQKMLGRLALNPVVANAEALHIPGEGDLTPPKQWVAKYAR